MENTMLANLLEVVSGWFWFLASTNFWSCIAVILWIHRYLRLIVHCFSHWTYKSKPIPEKPEYTADDVTVVIPTIHNCFEELRASLESILACKPRELILVTTFDKEASLKKLASTLSSRSIRVLCSSIANKRLQVCEALPQVKTRIIIMADDDVTWPSTLMPWILAPFEDPKIGGVGTCQRVRRDRSGSWIAQSWNWLGSAYIERRNFEISATHNMDGGTSCMSGRTGAYKAEILQSQAFLDGFKNERWQNYTLNADDDNFVTRWLVSHQWKTWIQYNDECEIETTLEVGTKFLYQCSRWARSNWRSNYTSLFKERYVIWQQPWCTYALHLATFTSLAFVFDVLIPLSMWWGTEGWEHDTRVSILVAQLVWMFGFTKWVKLLGLFRRHPSDLVFLPVSILFGYYHGFVKLYALFTLNQTSWGSRPDGDLNDALRMSPRPMPNESIITPTARPDDLDHLYRRPAKSPRAMAEKAMLAAYGHELPPITVVAASSPGSPFSKPSGS
ncbi:putative Nucleotide-diphospho-sugar transferase [Seiridium cardinale]|uniref:Nucleotide-diphospho-sugar transferase n=1 Tax=Seiridium cardinale TaxID=138064 RepID=A0ABR2Y0X8_9PEZI